MTVPVGPATVGILRAMARTDVKAHRRKDGSRVRAHDRRVSRSAGTSAADTSAASAAAAAANDTEIEGFEGFAEDDAWSDEATLVLTGSLARRGKPETDGQQRLRDDLEQYFRTREEWKDTLVSHATIMENSRLNGGNIRRALQHQKELRQQGIKPTGVMMSKSGWEKLGREVTGEGFAITVPRTVPEKEEEDPDTGETTTVGGYMMFGHGGKGRRYYDGAETAGDGPVHSASSLTAELFDQATNATSSGLADTEMAALYDSYTGKAADWGITVEDIPLSDMGGAHGWYDPLRKKIAVAADASPAARIATLVHELAHAADPTLKGPEANENYARDRAGCEFVAESVAFAVLDRHGIDSSAASAMYLHSWKPERIKQAKNLYKRCVSAMNDILERPAADGDSQQNG